MNIFKKVTAKSISWLSANLIRVGFLLPVFLMSSISFAAEPVCAVVKIEIAQELTLERQAFDAVMRINNGLDLLSLENVVINVTFKDETGAAVIASSVTTNPDPSVKFFIAVDSMTGIDAIDEASGGGTVAPKSTAEVHWLIIPTPGSADAVPTGKLYFIGATLKYNLGGEAKTTVVSPDSIYVKPLPKLALDYFLEQDVFADDAFTPAPEIEPAIPFTLGVRVKNNGAASATGLKIDSAQPKIIENVQGLLVAFNIIGSNVNDSPKTNSLLIDFGEIKPNESSMGRWDMVTTLSGEFTDFTASFSHADALGGNLTSIIDPVINTHTLIRNVRVDVAGRDLVRDFLALDGTVYNVYESSGVDTVVTDVSDQSTLVPEPAAGEEVSLTVTIPVGSPTGFSYAKKEDIYAGTKVVKQIVRSDGKIIPLENVWLSKTRLIDNDTAGWNYWFNLFDANTTGTYTLFMGAPDIGPVAPVFTPISNVTTFETVTVTFPVSATDANGDAVILSTGTLPTGASFTSDTSGSGTFSWTPSVGQAGNYTISFIASDGTLSNQASVIIKVNPAWDTDGDGMDDAWEIANFGDLSRDGIGDLDGDGVSDLQEYLNNTDPNLTPPLVPTNLVALSGNAENTLNWDTVTGVDSYNVYWSLTADVTPANGTVLSATTLPFVHTGLNNDVTYYYIVTSVGAGGESAASNMVSVTTGVRDWSAPVSLQSNSGFTFTPLNAQIAMSANGNAIAVWQQTDNSLNSIWSSRYVPATGWTTPALISDNTVDSSAVQIAMDNDGNAIAVWQQVNPVQTDIITTRYNVVTGIWETPVSIETDDVNPAVEPQIVISKTGTNSGNALVIWKQGTSIMSNSFVSLAWQGSAVVSDEAITDISKLALSMNENGDAFAAWVTTVDQTNYDLRVNKFSTNIWSNTVVTLATALDNWLEPAVVINASGNAVMAWPAFNGTRHVMTASQYDVSTNIWATAQAIETNLGEAKSAQVAMDVNGNAFVAWVQSGSPYSIYVNRLDASLGFAVSATLLETRERGDASVPQLKIDSRGNAIVSWQHSDGVQQNILAAVYNNADNTWGAERVIETTNTGDALSPAMAMNDSGDAIVVWQQNNNGVITIAANHFEVGNTGVPNINPIAVAGADQSVDEQTVVTLDGSASFDQDSSGLISNYSWTQTAGTPVTLTAATTATPGFTAPVVFANVGSQTLTFELTVTDDVNAASTQTVNVVVNPVNVVPVANAGVDITVNEQIPVNLSAALSSDSDGNIASYQWSQVSGTPVTLATANTATASFTAPLVYADTALLFQLTVTDNEGGSATDSVTITVNNINPDDDGDGMDDAWEMLHFGNLTQIATTDFDGDGYSNLQEYTQGTNPIAVTPMPPTTIQAVATEEGVHLRWDAVAGTTGYNIYWASATGVTRETGTVINHATNSYTHSGLTVGTTYYYIITTIVADESLASTEVNATPGIWAWKTPVHLNEANKGDTAIAVKPRMAMTKDGSQGVMAWVQDGVAVGQNLQLWVSHYTTATGWGTPVNISPASGTIVVTDTNATDNAAVEAAIDEQGNAIVVWRQNLATDLYAKRYTSAGGWSAEVLIDTTSSEISNHTIAMSPDGIATVVWQEFDGTRNNIWANRFDGTVWTTATLIETSISSSFKRPNVAMDVNGNAIAVWYGYDGSIYNVWANRYDAITGWGTATLLESDNVYLNALVDVVMDSDGNATAVWVQCSTTASYCNNVMANQYVPVSGWGTAEKINNVEGVVIQKPRLAKNERDEITVVWTRNSDSQGQTELHFNRYNSISGWGAAVSNITPVSTYMAMDVNDFGEIAVAWGSVVGDSFSGNFLTKRYVPGKGWTGSTLINAASGVLHSWSTNHVIDLTMMPDGQAMFAYDGGGFPAISKSSLLTTALPVVDAGSDQTVYEGDTVSLSGNSSTTTYLWQQYGGTKVTLQGDTTATPSFVAPITDDVLKANFILRTESLDGYISTDTVTITVLDINTDTDNDGMADRWEQQYFGNLAQTGNEDFDGDGISNRDEFNTGTDPTIAGPPAAPSKLVASTANGVNTLSWTTVSGVSGYNIYWDTTPGVTKTTGTLINSVTNPYTHSGLTNNTPYYYVVTAVGLYGESAESIEVRATPGSWAWKLPVKLNEGTEPNSLSSYIAPKVAMNTNGQGVMSWFQNYSLWVSHYDSDTGWGSPVNIVPNINNDVQHTHNIDIDDEGNIIAIWTQNPNISLHAVRYTPVGGWGVAKLLETSGSFVLPNMEPSIAMSADGSAIVTWNQSDGTKFSIWASRYDPVTEWETATLLESDDAQGNWYPKVVSDSQGNAIVVWWRNYGLGIFAKRYDAVSGWGLVERLDSSSNASYAEIGIDASGNALVVWRGLVGGPVGIFATRYTPGGGWEPEQKIGFDNLPGEQLTYPHVAINDRGEAAAVWSWNKTNEWSEIRTNRYTAGSGWSAPESFTPATRQTYTSDFYSLVTGLSINAFGDIAVAWWEDSGRYWTKNYKSSQGWSASTVMNDVPRSDGSVKSFVNFDLVMDANGHAIFAYDANGLPVVSHYALFPSLPNAAAGADQTVYSGDRVTLDGQGSTGTIADYRWTAPRFVDIGLVDDTTSTPEFTAPKASVFDFALTTVSAEGALSASDIVKISVVDGDSDNDGLHDAWEQQYFGNLVNDGSLDSDSDGISDYDEYVAGTDPWVAGPPAAPSIVKAVAGDTSNNIAWTSVGGASSYNIYWSTSPGVTKATGTLVANVTSSYAHIGLTNGTAYYYVVTAVGLNGESVESAESIATPGTKAWAAPALIENNANTAINPKIVVDELGNSIAVWQQTDGTFDSVWANRYDIATGIWGTPQLLETDTTADHQNPHIDMDRAGNVLAIWNSSSNVIYSNYYNAASGWGAYQQIGYSGKNPKLAMNTNGQAIAAWHCLNTTVCTSRFDGAWTSEITLNNSNLTGTVGLVSVALNARGDGVVAWPQDGNIWAQRFSALKQDWQAAEVADTNNLGNTSSPKVVMDYHGNITIIWNQLSATDNLWANRYGRTTGWSTPSLIENDDSASASVSDSQLEIDLSGNALVLWDHWDNIMSTYYTFGSGWDVAPSIFALPNGSSAPNEPRLALSPEGNGVAVFSFVKSGKRLLYASPYVAGQGWGDLSAISAGEPSNPDIVIAPDGKAAVIWSELGSIVTTTQ